MKPSAKELDKQSVVKIDKWIDINSEECRNIDDNLAFTKKCIRIGVEDGYMFADSLGRLWCGRESDGQYNPFHFSFGSKNYGYKISTKAAN